MVSVAKAAEKEIPILRAVWYARAYRDGKMAILGIDSKLGVWGRYFRKEKPMILRKCGLFTTALVCIVLTACQQTSAPGEKAAAPDPAPINALRDQFVAAFNAGNAAEVANIYTDDAILMLANQPAFEGKQAIQAAFQALFQDNTVKLTMTAQEIQIAGDWAYERGASSFTVTPKAGGKPVEDSRKYLVIFKRLPGGAWKAHRDTDSSNYPLPEPPGLKKN